VPAVIGGRVSESSVARPGSSAPPTMQYVGHAVLGHGQ
jgi:hypothetical protein